MGSRHWTRHEKRQLRMLVNGGFLIEELADRMGRTYGGVRYMARQMGIRFRVGGPPDMVKRARLIRLIEDGFSLRKIARLLGQSPGTVCDAASDLRRQGLLRREGRRLVVVKEAS